MSSEAPQGRVALFFAVTTFQPREQAGVHDLGLGRRSGLAGQLGTVKTAGLRTKTEARKRPLEWALLWGLQRQRVKRVYKR